MYHNFYVENPYTREEYRHRLYMSNAEKRRRERSDEERQKRADFDSTPLNLILIGLLSTC